MCYLDVFSEMSVLNYYIWIYEQSRWGRFREEIMLMITAPFFIITCISHI